jgi:hypothetical protein
METYMFNASWRVRYVFSENLAKLAPYLEQSIVLNFYTDLLQDGETEVRISACSKLSMFVEIIDPDSFENQVLPLLQQFSSDTEDVKIALAPHINSLFRLYESAHETAHTLFSNFLTDKTPAVKLAMLDNVADASRVLGDTAMAFALVPAVHSLFTNDKWRVRVDLVSKFPMMSLALGIVFFNSNLTRYIRQFFSDTIHSVR